MRKEEEEEEEEEARGASLVKVSVSLMWQKKVETHEEKE